MHPRRGRTSRLEDAEFIEAVKKYQDQIVAENRIVNRNHCVWKKLAEHVNFKWQPISFFVKVSGNHMEVKDFLLPDGEKGKKRKLAEFDFDESLNEDISYDAADVSVDSESLDFDFTLTVTELDRLTHLKYLATSKNGKKNVRLWRLFKPGEYQDFFIKKIWEVTHVRCGFLFQHSYISMEKKTGNFDAKCKCGAKLYANLEAFMKSDVVIVSCKYTPGSGKCGKPYLRNPIRKNVAEDLEKEPVEAYRTKQAQELMTREIDPEPPIVRRPEVLYQVKREATAAKYCHGEPIQALTIMKYNEWFGSIGEIGYDPFFVHYWTNSGIQAYKHMCARAVKTGKKICAAVDSTGGTVRKIGNKNIFLHVLAVGVPEGQTSLAHMLSETAHTESISHWLKMWRRAGAPIPDICVTDWSRALLHGVASAFTGYQTIEEYTENLPDARIYIRLDVAHTVHKYARYCKKYRKQVKTFLMASVGQLIISSSKYQARQLIRKILVVCLSETNGNLKTGEKSPADVAEEELMKMITKDNSPIDEDSEETVENSVLDGESEWMDNSWYQWGQKIKNEVEAEIAGKVGDRLNAYYDCREFTEYLLKDVSLLPLWTNIYASNFGVDGKNASSAVVEQVFRKIKHTAFSDNLPMRVDRFVQEHLTYLNGKSKLLVDAMVLQAEEDQQAKQYDTNENDSAFLIDSEDENNRPPQMNVLSSIENFLDPSDDSENTVCSTCKKPAGNHICVLCKKKVHAIPPCSSAAGEEGYGQKRVCSICQANPDSKNVLALNDFENWGNLGVKNAKLLSPKIKTKSAQGKENKSHMKKRSLYLGDQKFKIKDMITIKTSKSIPIIKNGSTAGLSAVKINKQDIHFQMTCGFDSILQIILAHAFDDETFLAKINEYGEKNQFFELVSQIHKHGITANSYTLRGKILKKAYEGNEDHPLSSVPDLQNTFSLDCHDNIGNIAEHIFARQFPSYLEVRTCANGCEVNPTAFACYEVLKTELVNSSMKEIVEEWRRIGRRGTCSQPNCLGSRVDRQILGDIVLFNTVYDEGEEKMELQNITRNIEYDPQNKIRLRVLGIVDLHIQKTRRSENDIGHYTALCWRQDGTWVRYDDFHPSGGKTVSVTRTKVNPGMIITEKIN